jgi:amidophosphoribosyltransferase
MGEFVAFQAVVGLTKERNQEHLLWEAYARCKAQETLPKEDVVNEVAGLYAHYSYEEVSAKIAKIITPPDIDPMIEVIYQTIDDLHRACPQNLGDWYFSGNYPTPGGNKVVNKAFMLFMEQKDERAY